MEKKCDSDTEGRSPLERKILKTLLTANAVLFVGAGTYYKDGWILLAGFVLVFLYILDPFGNSKDKDTKIRGD